ncbi:MAG: Septum formation protein Maf [Anaerolineales bacterium]|nr:Septum formation protein Maf [Anaerolineales bacterium]
MKEESLRRAMKEKNDCVRIFPLMDKTRFILASNSPRRKQLFALGGWDFAVLAADVDETPFENEPPREYVVRLAKAKSLAIQPRAESEAVIVGSDTTVADGDQILGKPVDEADARRMLRQLRGRVHQVFTGIAILQNGRMFADLCVTDVPMREYSDDEIERYIQSGDPMDKAGAYAIQHPDFQPVKYLEGCYASVMGLPMCHILRALRQFQAFALGDVPGACQSLLNYDCKVSSAVLRGELVS